MPSLDSIPLEILELILGDSLLSTRDHDSVSRVNRRLLGASNRFLFDSGICLAWQDEAKLEKLEALLEKSTRLVGSIKCVKFKRPYTVQNPTPDTYARRTENVIRMLPEISCLKLHHYSPQKWLERLLLSRPLNKLEELDLGFSHCVQDVGVYFCIPTLKSLRGHVFLGSDNRDAHEDHLPESDSLYSSPDRPPIASIKELCLEFTFPWHGPTDSPFLELLNRPNVIEDFTVGYVTRYWGDIVPSEFNPMLHSLRENLVRLEIHILHAAEFGRTNRRQREDSYTQYGLKTDFRVCGNLREMIVPAELLLVDSSDARAEDISERLPSALEKLTLELHPRDTYPDYLRFYVYSLLWIGSIAEHKQSMTPALGYLQVVVLTKIKSSYISPAVPDPIVLDKASKISIKVAIVEKNPWKTFKLNPWDLAGLQR